MKLPLKLRLARGESVFGSFAFLPSPDAVEIMALAGFDFVIIDLEHSPKDWSAVTNMVRAAELYDMAPLIRVRENAEKTILEALEVGAEGIVVPFVQDAADIRHAASAMNYPPRGQRGTCTLTRAARYGGLRHAFIEHAQRQNEALVLVAQVEDQRAVDAIEEILACDPGPDVVLVGRSDLASSLGRPGQVEDPLVIAATRRVLDAARRRPAGPMPTGIGLYAPEEAAKWIEAGCRFFFYSADTALLMSAAKSAVEAFKAALQRRQANAAAE